MPLSKQTQSARVSLTFITVGALLDVWTAVYYFLVMRPQPEANNNDRWFWVTGFFLTGLTLLVIGMLLGKIGQAARHAEVAPAASHAPLDDSAVAAQMAQTAGTPLRTNTRVVTVPKTG